MEKCNVKTLNSPGDPKVWFCLKTDPTVVTCHKQRRECAVWPHMIEHAQAPTLRSWADGQLQF